MYESFYGLKEKPFNITPDPDYFYMSQVHENAYTHLQYAIQENKGFVVITGEIGSGKTTLINLLLKNVKEDILVGVMSSAKCLPAEFIKMACQELELPIEGMDRVEMVDALQEFLLKQFSERKRVVLIMDEAQHLPLETIEEIRMLSNLDTEKDHLLQMILVGQPELKAKLQQRQLKQFVQRITVHCHLRGLTKEETRQYIDHRIHVAGAKKANIFHQEAIEAVYEHSRGIPRMINILCDSALLYGYADDLKTIDKKAIEEVVKERQAEGFFTPGKQDESEPSPSSTILSWDPDQWEKRIQMLEKKTNIIGKAAVQMNRRLEALAKQSKERDRMTAQLLKLLKQNMKSRKEMHLNYKELKGKERTDSGKVLHSPILQRRAERKR
jgi:general secretion pathway protein A